MVYYPERACFSALRRGHAYLTSSYDYEWLQPERSMATAVTDTRYTPAELLTMPDTGRYELTDGQLVERKRGSQSSYMAARLLRLLGLVTEARGLGCCSVLTAVTKFSPMIPAVSGMRMGSLSSAADCPVTRPRKATVVSPRSWPSRPSHPTIWPVPSKRKSNSGWRLVSVWCGYCILTHIGYMCTGTMAQ